jgi:hypothetical protein
VNRIVSFRYHEWRTHLSLDKNAPVPRTAQPPACGTIVPVPHLGGLHDHYERRATTLRQIAADGVLFFDFLRRLPEDKYGEIVVPGIATRTEKRRATMACAE